MTYCGKNSVERGRPLMTKWRIRMACWIAKATDIHSEYVILNDFPLQQCLHERVSMLRYTYTVCIVNPYPANVENMVSS